MKEFIKLSHGSGGKGTKDLIEKFLFPFLKNEYLEPLHDGAVFKIGDKKFAFTTDSYVVSPIFFKGGDIGKLSIYGTVNDLSMCGARPVFISLSLIIEEGFPFEKLEKIMESIKYASKRANVLVITGDTKVVEKGKGDGIYINTAGIGIIEHDLNISPYSVKEGDKIIINGSIGMHGIAIMNERENLGIEGIYSDTQPLNFIIQKLIDEKIEIHCLRDPTRGGVATSLNEIAEKSKKEIVIYEEKIPIKEEIIGACEILGIDPLYVANEGKFLLFVPEKDSERALKIIKEFEEGKEAEIIGEVKEGDGKVFLKTKIGARRIVDIPVGEILPRIC
jgi:hydrogenase expression/formation protein HypE